MSSNVTASDQTDLMKEKGLTVEEALNLLKAARPIVSPNKGFMAQLNKYQDMLTSDGLGHENVQ